MCGIAGEAGSAEFIQGNEAVAVRMADTLRHRGPNDAGQFCIDGKKWRVNLAMRRLAIIDREHGHQPMQAGRATVIFNGEIYNHGTLRERLKRDGIPCKTHCDTEVIARLWEQRQPTAIVCLEGMFAFALWDRKARELYLVRDRLGKKPLYYYWDEDRNLLVFASEMKALLTHPQVPKEINPEGIYHYLSLQYVPEPMTAFRGIRVVPPGSFVTYRPADGTLDVTRYWSLKVSRSSGQVDGPVYTRQVRASVERAVQDRLESEVPLGVYLSGGIDSSIVTAIAAKACPELHTFSMGFQESAYNELPYARDIAERFGTVHHEAMVTLPQLRDMADRIVEQYDQPFGDCSAIPTMLLCEASKQYITVALSGDGGDEAFGGYERYLMAEPKAGIIGYTRWMTPIPCDVRDKILRPQYIGGLNCQHTNSFLLDRALTYGRPDLRGMMMWMDIHTYLPNDIIVKMERASMAASVEVRCPFLDHQLMEFAVDVPDYLKFRADVGKFILKEAFSDVLPLETIIRPKRGFSIPVNEWFRAEAGQELLAEMTSDLRWPWDLFVPSEVTGLIQAHLGGRANIGHALWMLLMLHLWMKRHFG